jgi:hypothetical protein
MPRRITSGEQNGASSKKSALLWRRQSSPAYRHARSRRTSTANNAHRGLLSAQAAFLMKEEGELLVSVTRLRWWLDPTDAS